MNRHLPDDAIKPNAVMERWLLVLVPLCAALPLLLPPVPPLTDIGAHLGRLAVQLDRGADPRLAQWFTFHWALLPNLGTDLLAELLAPLFGLEPALRLIVVAIPALQALGVLLVSRAVHGRITPSALLAVPLAYGFVLQMGFINYALAVALGLLALALWIRLGAARRDGLRAALFVPIGLVLWVCHLAGWAVFCVLAAAQTYAALRSRRDMTGAALGTALALLPLALGPVLGLLSGAAGGAGAVEFSGVARKLAWLQTVVWDRWAIWDRLSATALIGLAAWFGISRWFEADRGLALGGAALTALFVVLPFGGAGSYYVDMRLVPVMLTIWLLAARPAPSAPDGLARALMLGALAFAGARLAGNAISLKLEGDHLARSLEVVGQIPRNARLVTLHALTCATADRPNAERRAHIGGYALARRHAFDNAQFIQPGGQLLRVHNPAAGAFENEAGTVLAAGNCGAPPLLTDVSARIPPAVDHLWVVGIGAETRLPGWKVAASSGDSVLYSRACGTLRNITESPDAAIACQPGSRVSGAIPLTHR
ncbi:GtrA family protein [Novosphingobium flavum]|uniref:GtrA family protein n=1 Tax=Novosphingobium flavum TaxID=1778672 RepID=A0A7X1FTA8_9SPHN|nr:GtrA family protein [Novosphingobium flavum]MBC2666563.1 GtrA family protein [Novosphingobium flavum]